jgi:glycosyltransferase involved in cell wall biosynthesis
MNKIEILNQCAPGASVTEICSKVLDAVQLEDRPQKAPFLSVITRTVGKRLDGLREVFLCLAGQDCMDFEVILLGHNLSYSLKQAVLREIEHAPREIRKKIIYNDVTGGTRTTPINAGFEKALGEYIAILDDDDLVFSNWVSSYYSLFKEHKGKLFHSGVLKQEFETFTDVNGRQASIAIGPYQKEYIGVFNYANMVRTNKCPPFSIAFPRWVFHNCGIRFDETLTTTEDWDYIMRCAFICGVAETGVITGIYRWWCSGYSSRTEHNGDEWRNNQSKIEEKFEHSYFVLPPDGVHDMVELNKRLEQKQHEWNVLKNLYDERVFCRKKLALIRAMKESFSWKITAPLRLKETLKGNWKPLKRIEELDYHRACVLHDKMLNSRSIKIANYFRAKLKKQK